MWLVTTLMAAVAVTAVWRVLPKNHYRLDFLALMLWGLGIMIIVDHVLAYEGGAFLETETSGLVTSGLLLGVLMLLPVIVIWLAYLAFAVRKKNVTEG